MSFDVWIFTFNELCDSKNLKKLISGSCLTPIIQSYINNLNIYIYIWAWSTQNVLWSAYFFVNLFPNIQLFVIFESDHIWFQHHFIHMCVHPRFFFTIFKNWKTKYTLLKRMHRCVDCTFLRNFWMCIFYLADFSLSCFKVVVRFSKCKV